MKINFKCPKCGCKQFEEIMGGAIVVSEVKEEACYQGEGQIELQYGEQTNESGEVERYQCKNCGHFIASTNEKLFAYLHKHKMVELDEVDQKILDEEEAK